MATSGALVLWNQQNPSFLINVGDDIVSVNGRRGDATSMFQEMLSSADLVKLSVRKAPVRARLDTPLENGNPRLVFARQT